MKIPVPAPSAARVVSAVSVALLLAACGTSPRTAPTPSGAARVHVDVRAATAPRKYFVELQGDPGTLSRLSIGAQHATFRAQAAQLGGGYRELRAYGTLFNGFAVLATPSQANRLSRLPGVRAVTAVRTVPNPLRGRRPLLRPLDVTSGGMIGADVARSEYGLTGQGVKVGVIDSGIDAGHPAFAGRITAGHDFVGDAYDAGGDGAALVPVPDTVPNDCNGHGTHVSGIVGGNDPAAGNVGVAPGVLFGEYKIFGCEGSSDDEVILAAMERAAEDGMDVINMSLGSAFDTWAQTPLAQAASRLVKRGVVVVASAGNSGTSGAYSMGGPSMGENVIAVASVSNTKLEVSTFTVTPGGRRVAYEAGDGPVAVTAGAVLPLGKGAGSSVTATADGCDAADGSSPYAAGSLTGRAALIRRGGCTFHEKVVNAQGAGAKAVVVYNSGYGFVSPGGLTSEPAVTIPVVGVTGADGAALDAVAGGAATIMFGAATSVIDNPTANSLDTFSSYGMSAELELKPDLAAPGGFIRSAWPRSLDASGYQTLSGTSMAAPHVAGAAALLLQGRPTLDPRDVRAVLMNTSVPRAYRAADGTVTADVAYVQQQGAGMVSVVGAHTATVSATPEKLSLGDSATFATRSKVVVLRNSGAAAQTYTVTHVPALALSGSTFTPAPSGAHATVRVNGTAVDARTGTQVTVPAQGEAELNVLFTPPGSPDRAQYGGYVQLRSATGSTLVVPYSGLVGDYQSVRVLVDVGLYDPDTDTAYAQEDVPAAPLDFTLAGDDVPVVYFLLGHPSRALSLELLTEAGVDVLGTLPYLPRSADASDYLELAWDGTRGDGSDAPNGTYRLRVKVLKALGDPNVAADVETYTSQPFTVARP